MAVTGDLSSASLTACTGQRQGVRNGKGECRDEKQKGVRREVLTGSLSLAVPSTDPPVQPSPGMWVTVSYLSTKPTQHSV